MQNFVISGRNAGRGRVRVGHAPGQHQSGRPRLAVRVAEPLDTPFKERILIRIEKTSSVKSLNIFTITECTTNEPVLTTCDFKREERNEG